jgi:N-6 DNA Methylase
VVISPRRRLVPSVADLHRQWLELVDTDGPFLAVSPLKRVWPQGIPALPEDRREALSYARKDFESAWEAFDRSAGDDAAVEAYRVARGKWVETVLRDIAGWAESLSWDQVPGVQAQSPNRAVTLTAQAALSGTGGNGALVHMVDPVESLRQTPNDLWAATPIDRIEALLRDNGCEIGIVTDGRWWGLVCAREGSMVASGVVDALTWIEEPRTRDAFLAVIGRQYIVGGDPAERLPVLFAESVAAAEEITEALGAQVRRAVELLVQSFSESAADATRRGTPDPLPENTHQVYEAAVTVMMRTVFLLFAEERGLLPSGELFAQGYGISNELDRLQAREIEDGEEALDATSLTWHRLLATSQALYRGTSFESMRMPAYGGSLFDPARFRFMTAATEHGTLTLTVSDRVMLHVLRSVQQAMLKGVEARRISFRDIDVEQIGYIYEGLLGYTAVAVNETYVGLRGTSGEEPEIPLSELERLGLAAADPKKFATSILAWVEKDQPSAKPQSVSAITKAAGAEVEPNIVSGLTQVAGGDDMLRERILPWLSLVRLDLRGRPFVVLDGGLMVKETPSRKNAGAHYTPKSLAEEVVLHALQPLCYSPGPHQTAKEADWKLKSSDDILSLKVADIACGSGAFLVAAARYLADRVVEAWTSENPVNSQRGDLKVRAVREVVANCLYGADINDMAVEMCKLSLWLVSLDRDLPFSFVDDKVFHGNSLLGLISLDQLRKLHIDPTRVPAGEMFDIFDVDIDAIIRKAVGLRERLATPIDDNDPARNSASKHRQLDELRTVTADLRTVADGVIAAGLPLGGKPGKALDEAYENLRVAVKAAHPQSGHADTTFLDGIIDSGLTPTVVTDYRRWKPLHWIIEAPDVLNDHRGFDAIVGNPPFLGGQKITGAMGINIRDWFVNALAFGAKGSADQVAYFFLRSRALIATRATLGLIATNTIAQGNTREVGLDQMVENGFTIARAVQSRSWPTSTASLDYAAVWGTLDHLADSVPRICDDVPSRRITAQLEPGGRVAGKPVRLVENASIAFQGCILLGTGFVIEASEARAWITSDVVNAEVLSPYLVGDDVNSRADFTASRWVIDFFGRTLEQAHRYSLPLDRVRRTVKPERDRNSRKARRDKWWLFAEAAAGMRAAIADLENCIVIRQTSNTLMPVLVPADQVMDQTVIVFGTCSSFIFGVLSSGIHYVWAATHGLRTMAGILRYTMSDVFETFPLPQESAQVPLIAEALQRAQSRVMKTRGIGLTPLYRMVNDLNFEEANDRELVELRSLQTDLDVAVMEAYGWSDVELHHGFHGYRGATRYTVCPAARVEILDRLLEENQRRAASQSTVPKPSAKARRTQTVTDANGTLFE